jgi:hypothetical protein
MSSKAATGWSRKFDEPITIPPRRPRGRSRQFVTLEHVGDYVAKLPKAAMLAFPTISAQ